MDKKILLGNFSVRNTRIFSCQLLASVANDLQMTEVRAPEMVLPSGDWIGKLLQVSTRMSNILVSSVYLLGNK